MLKNSPPGRHRCHYRFVRSPIGLLRPSIRARTFGHSISGAFMGLLDGRLPRPEGRGRAGGSRPRRVHDRGTAGPAVLPPPVAAVLHPRMGLPRSPGVLTLRARRRSAVGRMPLRSGSGGAVATLPEPRCTIGRVGAPHGIVCQGVRSASGARHAVLRHPRCRGGRPPRSNGETGAALRAGGDGFRNASPVVTLMRLHDATLASFFQKSQIGKVSYGGEKDC